MFLGRPFGARREISDEMTMEMLLPNMVVMDAGSRAWEGEPADSAVPDIPPEDATISPTESNRGLNCGPPPDGLRRARAEPHPRRPASSPRLTTA